MNEKIQLDDIKKDSLKTVSISDIAPKEESRIPSAQQEKENIMDNINKAQKRYVENFEKDMKEKFENEAAEKKSREVDEDLNSFLNEDSPSHKESSIDFDVVGPVESEDQTHIAKKESIVVYDDNEFEVTANEENDVQEKDVAKDVIDDKFEIPNADNFNASLQDSEAVDDEDFTDILENKDLEAEQKELVKSIKEKLNPVKKPVDLSALEILKNPTSVNNALSNQMATNKHVSDWVLFEAKRTLSMESYSGTELEKMDTRNYPNRNRYNLFLQVYKMILEHIPALRNSIKLVEWLKTLSFFDITHLWFLVYKATFEKANIIPYVCEDSKCEHKFVKEIDDIMKMVKFASDEDKAEFEDIFNNAPHIKHAQYKVQRKQITDDIVIDFRDPSVWNVIFENAILPEKFRSKYATLLNTLSFIDGIFSIKRDAEGNALGLSPIAYKDYPDDMLKDIMSRIYSYAKILEALTKDQKSYVDAFIVKITQSHKNVSYVIPACNCERCGKPIKEAEATGEELVFIRQELADMILS